jgi:hypothetical protein
MKEVKIGGKNVEVPTSWSEVNFKQFQNFHALISKQKTQEELDREYEKLDDDIRHLQISLDNVKFNTKMVAFWSGLSEDEVAMSDIREVENVLLSMEFINSTYQPIALSKFTFEGETYHLPEVGMTKENFGTYIEAEQVELNNQMLKKGHIEVIPRQAAIICKKDGEERGLINDELVDKRAKLFENLDMATIWDIGFFLSKQENKLMSNILISLKQAEMQKHLRLQKEQ